MSMPSNVCEIKNFKPSAKTLEYLEEMREISTFTTALKGFTAAGTLYQLLSGRGLPAKTSMKVAGLNISLYSWDMVANTLSSADVIRTAAFKRIIQFGVLDTSGKDRIFWQCMYNISK